MLCPYCLQNTSPPRCGDCKKTLPPLYVGRNGNPTITSAAKNVDAAVYEHLKAVNGKTDKAGILTANLKNGGVGLAPYHDWDSKIPQTVKDKIKQATDDLKSGKLATGYQP
jgi:basic membrane lipoprotein Med (substrate-binding protein (PBP1-ABC) superfamily)